MQKTKFTARLLAILSAIALCAGLASCGNDNNSMKDDAAEKAGMKLIEGISASGDLFKKPKITFKAPLKVPDNSYAILQRGNGKEVKDGERVCSHGIIYNAKTGKEVMNTWDKNKPDCTLVINKKNMTKQTYAVINKKPTGTTIALGIPAKGKDDPYVMALTLLSVEKTITKATGKAVTNIPANLPKVTLDKSGAPSLDKNNYVPDGKLVSQTLIEGTGKEVSAKSTVTAHYTGWTTDKDGKLHQFDSSWTRGTPADFSLDGQVIPGWIKGLAGKKVGSQVLLVIPPEDGYGKEDKKDAQGNVIIPANSTLYFVIDILYAS